MSSAQWSSVDEDVTEREKRGEEASLYAADQMSQIKRHGDDLGESEEKGKITQATEQLQKEKQGHSGLVTSVFDAAKGAFSHAIGKSKDDATAGVEESDSAGDMKYMHEDERVKPGLSEVLEGTEEQGRRAMEERRLKEFREACGVTGVGDYIGPEAEAQIRNQAAQEAAAMRGRSAKENIMGMRSNKNLGETIRSKLTMPTDIVEETLAARRHSGTGRTTDAEKDEVADVKMDTEEKPVGVVDSIKLKVSHRKI